MPKVMLNLRYTYYAITSEWRERLQQDGLVDGYGGDHSDNVTGRERTMALQLRPLESFPKTLPLPPKMQGARGLSVALRGVLLLGSTKVK